MDYTILPAAKSNRIRREFLCNNINKTKNSFYVGYNGCPQQKLTLWEKLDNYSVITQKAAFDILSKMPSLFVTWDDNSAKISRALQKSRMINLSGRELVMAIRRKGEGSNSAFVPAEFYCISEDMSEYVAFTRVTLKGVGRICLTADKSINQCGVPAVYKPMFECFGQATT